MKVRASLVERTPAEASAVIQASSDDNWGAGARDTTKRLVATLVNLDNPGYQPDRLGMHPAAVVGLLVGFVIVLSFVLNYILPNLLR